MPAKSKSQQRLMGMVHAYKKGELSLSNIDNKNLRDKIKKIADGISDKDVKKFAKTKHDELPNVKEGLGPIDMNDPEFQRQHKKYRHSRREREQWDPPSNLCPDCEGSGRVETGETTEEDCPRCDGYGAVFENAKNLTFKEFLVEITQKEREALIPPVAIQKLYDEIKKQHGFVKRETFANKAADRFNLTPDGLKRIMNLPSVQALPFGDGETSRPGAQPRDPWDHVRNKRGSRSEADANRMMGKQRNISPEKSDIIKRLGG